MAEPIRIYCDAPEYADTWIDILPRWSLADQERMLDVQGDEFFAFLRDKTAACHIETLSGAAITDPAQLTDSGLADVDVLLIGWLGSVLPLAVSKRRALGNVSARLSLPTNGGQMSRTGTTAPTTTAAQDA